MPRNLTSVALAVTVALGAAPIANAMQGVRTGNPPGPERPVPTQAAPSGPMEQGPAMMGQTGQGRMGNQQMPMQMAQMRDCPCCKRMAQMEPKQQPRR